MATKKKTTATSKPSEGKPQVSAPSIEAYNESVANDPAVEAAKGQRLGESNPQEGIADTKDNNEILKEDKELKEDVAKGEKTVIGDIPGYNQSVIQTPLVKDYLSDRPVYPTNEAAMLALAAEGKLATEAPKDKEVREINKKIEDDKKDGKK